MKCFDVPSTVRHRRPRQKPDPSAEIVRIPCEYCEEPIDLPNWATHTVSPLREFKHRLTIRPLLGRMSGERQASTRTTSSVSDRAFVGSINVIFGSIGKSTAKRSSNRFPASTVKEHFPPPIFSDMRSIPSLSSLPILFSFTS